MGKESNHDMLCNVYDPMAKMWPRSGPARWGALTRCEEGRPTHSHAQVGRRRTSQSRWRFCVQTLRGAGDPASWKAGGGALAGVAVAPLRSVMRQVASAEGQHVRHRTHDRIARTSRAGSGRERAIARRRRPSIADLGAEACSSRRSPTDAFGWPRSRTFRPGSASPCRRWRRPGSRPTGPRAGARPLPAEAGRRRGLEPLLLRHGRHTSRRPRRRRRAGASGSRHAACETERSVPRIAAGQRQPDADSEGPRRFRQWTALRGGNFGNALIRT